LHEVIEIHEQAGDLRLIDFERDHFFNGCISSTARAVDQAIHDSTSNRRMAFGSRQGLCITKKHWPLCDRQGEAF
jgi:hypothetical protein